MINEHHAIFAAIDLWKRRCSVLICSMTSRDHVINRSLDSVSSDSLHNQSPRQVWCHGCGDRSLFICHVTSSNDGTKGSSNFSCGSLLL